jgi:two-component system, OmpR family, response regulator MprA
MTEIMIVDDDASIRRMLERTLAAEGYEIRLAPDGGAALAELERSLPDLLVLDVTMPGLDGFAVAARARAHGWSLPILFLTARDTVLDTVAGFEAGGDDYLVKPFAVAELLVRLRALLRRTRPAGRELAYRDLRLDPEARRATRAGREIPLSARESALLELLLREAGRTVTRSEALAAVWDGEAFPNVVDRYVSYLRRKLGGPPVIETVRGAGFRIPP